MNSLFSIEGEWVGDGSEKSKIIVDGANVTLNSESRGTPFNIMLDAKLCSNSSIYYEADLVSIEGSISFGLVKKEDFKLGWKTKGLFYNGNVSNGSAALIVGFGEYPKEGDKVGVYAQRISAQEIMVAFYINNRCLGTAFKLSNLGENDIFFPSINVSGHATIRYSAPEILPTVMTREAQIYTDYSGEWKLMRAFVGPELGEYPLPSGGEIIATFDEFSSGNGYALSVHVQNNMSTRIKLIGEKIDGFDKIKISDRIASTMMAPLPPWDKVETIILDKLPDIYKMTMTPDLIMIGPTAEFQFQRYLKSFEPLTSYKQ